jgi:uncharacterized membrane protein
MLKKSLYWTCTAVTAFVFISGGLCYLLRVPKVVAGVLHLGFPLHFVLLLGMWKVLGGIAILVPGFKSLKEWAYAGMFFDLTGAAVASSAVGNEWWHVLVPLAFVGVLFMSWAFRTSGRTHQVLFNRTDAPEGAGHAHFQHARAMTTK